MSGASWARQAGCAGYCLADGEPWPWDTDQLTGKYAADRMSRRTAVAKALCASCPIRATCLAEGLRLDVDSDTPYGIWGGRTPEERAELLGKRIKWVSGQRRLASVPEGAAS